MRSFSGLRHLSLPNSFLGDLGSVESFEEPLTFQLVSLNAIDCADPVTTEALDWCFTSSRASLVSLTAGRWMMAPTVDRCRHNLLALEDVVMPWGVPSSSETQEDMLLGLLHLPRLRWLRLDHMSLGNGTSWGLKFDRPSNTETWSILVDRSADPARAEDKVRRLLATRPRQ